MYGFYNLPHHIIMSIYLFDPTFHMYYCQVLKNIGLERRIYYPEGKVLFAQFNKKSGIYKEFHDNKTPKLVCQYKNNRLTGQVFEYYNNGSIYKKYYCCDGILFGSFEEYYYNGKLMTLTNYYNGILHGCYHSFYGNGNLLKNCFYDHGKLVGSYNLFFEDGRLWKSCEY